MGKTQTIKKSKAVYVIGAITIGIIALIAVYFVLIATGAISAAPVRITVASLSSVAEYNGKEHKDERWILEDGELKEGHSLAVTFTGARTEAGECENSFTVEVIDANGYDVTKSYAITAKPGTLTVAPRKIVVASDNAEKNYDGTPLTAKSCAIADGELVAGHTIGYTINGTLTTSGRTENTFVATVRDGTRDVSANYDIEYLYGTLYVHGEMLGIATGSASKVYDGTPLTSSDWTLVSGKMLAADHVLSVEVFGSQTEIGEAENVASCAVTDGSGKDVTSMYEAVFSFGTLTVKPITIYVETQSAFKTYDGTPLTADGWRVITDGNIANDVWYTSGRVVTVGEYSVSATVVGTRTDAGISENTAVFVTVTRDGKPADGVAVECKCGELTVTKRNLTIRSGTAGKPFDGTPLTCEEWEIVSLTQPVEGHTVRVAVSGSITYEGIVDNEIAEYIVSDADGRDITHNYNVKLQLGKLSVYGNGSGSGSGGDGEGEGDDGNGSGNSQGGNGSGNGEGGSGGDVDDSGAISGGDGEGEADKAEVMKLFADSSVGKVYLKSKSFGDYGYTEWNAASAYANTVVRNSVFGGSVAYGMDYLTGAALSAAGSEYVRLSVQPLKVSRYYLPYYMDMTELNYAVQTSDVEYNENSGEYELYFHAYDYLSDGGARLGSADLGALASYERDYRKYVYDSYTAVPDGTREYMDGIIAAQGFDKTDFAACIANVAAFVRGSATYNKDYDRALDNESDIAVAFLDKYKAGICQHYATAATLLYRALGIPARYTIGYTGSVIGGEWTSVTGENAHAWVEVYADGAGWVNVEVTGGGGGNDGNGSFGGDGNGNESDDAIHINPYDVYVKYSEWDKKPITYDRDKLQGLAAFELKGYTYKFEVSGSQSEVGIGKSQIDSFTLYDKDGNDVTKEFSFKCSPGKLHIYMQEVTAKTASRRKVYDGVPLVGELEDFSFEGALLRGHSLGNVVMTASLGKVGSVSNTCDVTVLDGDGSDVTYMYKINFVRGNLNVTARNIVVTAGSAVGYLEELGGEGLTCSEYTVTAADGADGLCEGHRITVSLRGTQVGIGRTENVVESFVIYDADGVIVTENYSVGSVSGTLTVLPIEMKPSEEGA